MGHCIGTRIEVLGILTCLGPVHVGGWDNTTEASLCIARDGTGRPCLPGTSIAGALRAYLATVDQFRGDRTADLMNFLFGHIAPRGRGGSPSWIRVDDAHLIGEVTPAVRDGVGIDRVSASAAANFLYTRQVLPAGTRFALRLVADTPTTADVPDHPGGCPALVRDAIDAMVAGLAHGRVPIGAGRGRGFGRVKLSEVTIRTADLSQPAGLIAWLTGAAPVRPAPLAVAAPPPDGRLQITIGWHPTGPLLVRDSVSGTVVDALPVTDTASDGTVRLLLPGSSIRGAIRAHAERIVRTLLRRDAPRAFLDALRDPPPGVDVLFGSAPTGAREAGSRTATGPELAFPERAAPDGTTHKTAVSDGTALQTAAPHVVGPKVAALDGTAPEAGASDGTGPETAASDEGVPETAARNVVGPKTAAPDGAGRGLRGVLSVADCHSVGQISAQRWNDIVTTSPELVDSSGREEREARGERNLQRDQARSILRTGLAGIADSFSLRVSDHVAIDRWTGGAADQRLFSVLDPDNTVAWEPIQIEVDVTRLDPAAASTGLALPLLLLVLRDLRDGWISLGSGGTRGRGQIVVTGVTFDGAGLGDPWRSLAGKDLDTIRTDPPRQVVEAMTVWARTFQEAAA